jgi:hypothetical protein
LFGHALLCGKCASGRFMGMRFAAALLSQRSAV